MIQPVARLLKSQTDKTHEPLFLPRSTASPRKLRYELLNFVTRGETPDFRHKGKKAWAQL